MGKTYTAKTPSGDFKVTTPKNSLLSQQMVTSKGIPVPYTNLQLNKLYDLIGYVNNCLNFHVLYQRILLCFHDVNGECLFKLADDDDNGQW